MSNDDAVIGAVPTRSSNTSAVDTESATPRLGGNSCFVCGIANPIGLHVHFQLDGEVCRASFTPRAEHAGYDGVTHGGIVFSLLDDVMANGLWLRGERGFTARCAIRYRAHLPIGTGVHLEGRIVTRRSRLIETGGLVRDAASGVVYAEATAQFMLDRHAPQR